MFSPLLGAQLGPPSGAEVELAVDPRFEHGLLVDAGVATIDDVAIAPTRLAFAAAGRTRLRPRD